MPSVIDSLVLELGFDTAGADKGRKEIQAIFKHLRDDAEGTGKRIEDSALKVTNSITKMRNGLLDLLVVFTGGKAIESFIADLTQTDVAMGRLSRSTQTAVGTISSLEGAADASGGSAAGMASTISNLQSSFQQFSLTGQSAAIPYLRALGIGFKTSADGALDVNDQLTQLSAAAQRLGGGARAAELLRGAGVTDEGTLNLLLQGPEALARFRAAIDAAGTPKQSDIDAANKRNEVWAIWSRSLTTLGRNILTTLTPALLALGKSLTAITEAVSRSPTLMKALTVAVTALAGAITVLSIALAASYAKAILFRTGLGAILPLLGRLAIAVGTTAVAALSSLALTLATLTATTFPALSEAILAFGAALELTPIGWIITAIAALAAGAYLLITNWSAVTGFFKSMWKDIASTFQAGADKILKIPVVRWAVRKLGIGAPEAAGSPSPSAKPSPSGAGSSSAADRAINRVLKNEDSTLSGKVTNDTGGITKFGISSNAHPGLDVANLSLSDAKSIYKNEYWDPIGGDSLPAALQATALDAAINQGVGNAKKWLKESGGDPAKFNALRRGQYEHLAAANPGKYGQFLKAWEARVPSDTQTALATASAGAGTTGFPSGGFAPAAFSTSGQATTINNTDSDVHIGAVNITTRATDAKGIAGSIRPLLHQTAMISLGQQGPR